MRNQKGYVAGYNGQLVVTAQQVIVGTMLSQHPVDRTLLHPLLDTCRQQLAEAGIRPKLRTVLADSGYASEETFARADTDGLRLLAPLAKDPGHRPRQATPATSPRPGRLQDAGPHRGTSVRAAQDLPENDHDVPARPGRVRKRMAAGLRRAQPAQAAPPPRGKLTVNALPRTAKTSRSPKTTASRSVSAFQDLQPVLHTALRDRLKYAVLPDHADGGTSIRRPGRPDEYAHVAADMGRLAVGDV
jgi:hypothetical protein